MRIDKSLKLNGNINRILEMNAAGVGVNAIAGTFQDYGMNINADDVRGVLKISEELTKKAIPKKAVKQLIDQNNLGGFVLA
jgi:hypothetical protein